MPFAAVFSAALVWGLIWYPFRVLEEAGVSGVLSTSLIYLIAMLFGAFMLPRIWNELRNAGGWIVLLMVSVGWANLGNVLAVLEGEIMRVLLLFYIAPLWTILFSYWLLDERLNRIGCMVMLLSFSGAMVMLWEPSLGMPLPVNLAEWISLSAGMAFALSNVVARRASHLSLELKSYSVWIGTFLMTIPLLMWQGGVTESVRSIDTYSWTLLGLLGIVIFGVSFAVQYALEILPANRTIVLFLFELVVAAIASYYLADEAMNLRDYMGALLIISATLLSGKLYDSSETLQSKLKIE